MTQKLVIDRSKWLRGEGSDKSELLREEDGKMCCLGFYLEQCGVSRDNISGKRIPGDVPRVDAEIPVVPEWLIETGTRCMSSDVCQNLMIKNDSEHTHDSAREEYIAEKFAAQGIEVTFVDGEVAA